MGRRELGERVLTNCTKKRKKKKRRELVLRTATNLPLAL